jgi:ABC-type transport system involved in cytochrome c biogenesis permease subunit
VNETLKKLIAPLASLKLTVVLIALSMLLIYAGTWAQVEANIWQVQQKYFHSLFTWIDFKTLFPRPASAPQVPGGFPMLGGYALGLLLLANLLVAHGLRFKCTVRDSILLPLLALMIVPLIVWQYQGTDWLFNFLRPIGLDLAKLGAPFFVWPVLVSALVGIPFYFALFALHGRRAAIIMVHLGIILLLVGEGVTSRMQTEHNMQIDVGSYSNYLADTRAVEFAVVDTAAPDVNKHIIIPQSMLANERTIRDSRLPFDLTIDDFFSNSDIATGREATNAAKANAGAGVGVPVTGRAPFRGTDGQNEIPSAYITLSKAGQPLGTYLFTVMELAPRFKPINTPQPVTVDGKTYQVQLRHKRQYVPFKMHLKEFVHDKYTGTDIPKDFASLVVLDDPERHENREVRIWMNHPLRYRGQTFFQSGFKPGDRTTILQVVKNPAMVLPYAACTITAIGLVLHLSIMLRRFLESRPKLAPVPVLARSSGAPASACAGAGAGAGRLSAALFPPGIVLIGAMFVLITAIPRPTKQGNLDLTEFGALPVSFQGRVVPMDSLARNSIKFMRGTETLFENGDKVPPLRFLLDCFTDPRKAEKYKLFRIDNPDLKTLLNLPEAERYFAYAELLPAGAKFDEQARMVRDLPRGAKTPFQDAVEDLDGRLQMFRRITSVESLHAVAPSHGHTDWRMLGEVLPATADAPISNPSANAFVHVLRAYAADSPADLTQAVDSYRAAVAPVAPRAVEKASFETWYNNFSPLFLGCVMYVFVFILAACSWLGWSRPFARGGFALLVLTAIVHTVGIVARVYLSGRGPVTNLESSAIFIGWVVVLLGITLELFYRNGVGSVVSAVIGFITLTIYMNLAKDDTMKVLQAVLDTNFWLWTHVPAITIGYSATFLAGVMGAAYVIVGVFTRRLDSAFGKELTRMIYGTTCFAILFSFVGTVLGGIWADQSWGRFWGWDPKENGAVLIVLANALLLHSWWAGLARERGIACLAIFGNIVTAWSWFGTNMMGVGLHSYGFMDWARVSLLTFVASQLLLIALGNLPLHWWRSYSTMRAKHPTERAIAMAIKPA